MHETLPHRPLGASGIDVSIMSLGSWRTFERMSREEGVAVMRAAREAGIDFLDDARYDDETGTAPIPHRLVGGRVRRAVPRQRLATRRRDDRQQAVVGALARRGRRHGAGRLARPHGPRPRRPDLRHRPTVDAPRRHRRRAGRRAHRLGSGHEHGEPGCGPANSSSKRSMCATQPARRGPSPRRWAAASPSTARPATRRSAPRSIEGRSDSWPPTSLPVGR